MRDRLITGAIRRVAQITVPIGTGILVPYPDFDRLPGDAATALPRPATRRSSVAPGMILFYQRRVR